MAATVTDLRTIYNEADANTGWTGNTIVFTSDPNPAEATGSLGQAVSTTVADGYYTGTAVNLSNALVYVWALGAGTMATRDNTGIALLLGDGTNRVAYRLAGSDVAAFRHPTGPVNWQCLVVDTANLPTNLVARAGSAASLNLSAITQIGVTFTTLSKALGGSSNCFIDILRYGTTANSAVLRATAGTIGGPATFKDIETLDRSTATGRAHGVVRELGTNVFGLQGGLEIGDPTSGDTYFYDTDVTALFESRGLGTGRYGLTIRGNATGTTHFQLGDKVGSGLTVAGANGCTVSSPTGVGAKFDATTDTNPKDVFIYGSTFSGITGGIYLGAGHEFMANRVVGSGTIYAGGTTGAAYLTNTEITAPTVATGEGCLLWSASVDPDGYLDGVTIAKGANAHHAVEFGVDSPLTMTLRGLTFTGFNAANAASDSVLHIHRTSGTVTINLVDVSGTVSYKTDGATVVLVNARSLTLTGLKDGTEVRVYSAGTTTEITGQESVTGGSFQAGIDGATYPNIDIAVVALGYQNLRILNISMATDQTIPIQQQLDRQYLNP